MFLGINNLTRRRVLRAALAAYRDYIATHDGLNAAPAVREDIEAIDSILREISAAENLGNLPTTHEEAR